MAAERRCLLLAGVLLPGLAAAALPDADSWPVQCSRNCGGQDLCKQICSGTQTQVHSCPSTEPCPAALVQCPPGAEPVPCRFSAWSEWSTPLGCSGLCSRVRNMSSSNRCGGDPCKGPLEESRRCPNPCRSQLSPRPCAMSPWSDWGRCGSLADFQKQRRRAVLSPPRNGGHACSGLLEETAVCGNGLQKPVHCQVSAWMEWTPCTQKCGGGERMRLRTILTKSKHGGLSCTTSLSQVYACGLQPCPQPDTVNCQVGPWGEWGDCIRGSQRMRHRSIAVQASGGGKSCEDSLTQTGGCEKVVEGPNTCSFSSWSEWKFCDRTCGGGQTIRKRHVMQPAKPGGRPCQGELLQTTVCNTHPCSLAKQPCRVSAWSEWSPCTTTCGSGQQLRRRRILTEAQEGGLGCYLSLAEARGCPEAGEGGGQGRPQCGAADCAWAEWSEWSACSVSCEGGERSRSRHVAQEATAGGSPCDPKDTKEVEPCGMGPCEVRDCTDGKWGAWAEWSTCTKTCGGGYRFHHRVVLREANHCGQPAEGPSSEAEACNEASCGGDVDCELSEWSEWSSCSNSCMGTKKRSREIATHRERGGKTCGSSSQGKALQEVETCHADGCGQVAPQPICTLSEWGEWYNCPVSCGGGQTMRSRHVQELTERRLGLLDGFLPEGGGADDPLDHLEEGKASMECSGAITMTKPCNTMVCGEKQDCAYGEWSEWGQCTHCGGLQFRHRGITQTPEHEGKECSPKATNETRSCNKDCGKKQKYCAWENWSPWAACSKTCGAAMTFRRRLLVETEEPPEDPLALGSIDKDCDGKQIDVQECEDNPPCKKGCTPRDCLLGAWSEWSEPRCEGICERSRVIVVENNECGKPCSAILNTTKACEAKCDSRDCQLSPWSGWTQCASDMDQKFHIRTILQKPIFNGAGCIGPLNLTRSCAQGEDAPDDCQVSEWSKWGECDKTCGGGQQSRQRDVASKSRNGGSACDTSLSETRPCGTQSCINGVDVLLPMDCQLGPWSLWSKCGGPGGKQSFRKRILMHEAAAGGMPCEGRLYETRPCNVLENSMHRNCIFSTWSMWTTCPKTCGGAQHARSRSIEAHAKGHGLQCEGPLLQDSPCAEAPCPDAGPTTCKLSEWSEWGDCSVSCGEGFTKRHRSIAQPAPLGKQGCEGVMEEVKHCDAAACPDAVDCKWSKWQSWSECVPAPDKCGVGFRRRRRSIEELPKAGGKLCDPQVWEEISPVVNCKGQKECCIDGAWDDWKEWGDCSATCGSGTKMRRRELKVKETWCGKPASGPQVEYHGCESTQCNPDQDCVFSDWSKATPCSANCHGNRVRKRHVLVNATGNGKSCEGATEKTERCNPAEGQKEPYSCEGKGKAAGPQDCVMADWAEWSGCSATCERGYQTRFRQVKVSPSKGGKSCPSETRQLVTCHKNVTCFKDRTSCEWGEWTVWSDCSASGKRLRSRGVAKPSSNFGLGCQGPVREVASCAESRESCAASEHTCFWGEWEQWSGCSTTCGTGGVRHRSRRLHVANSTDAIARFEVRNPGLPALELQFRGPAARRAQELSLACVLGSASLTVILFTTWGATAGAGWLRRRWELRVLAYNAVPVTP